MNEAPNRQQNTLRTEANEIAENRTYLGIELGSTRIKGALVDEAGRLLASGEYEWENEYLDNNWTYSLDEVWIGIQTCFKAVATDVHKRWGANLNELAGIGVSAMMHGYLAFDADDDLLVPFRTWRNTYTSEAAALLTKTFGQNIPLRWSISHLLHSVLNAEEHAHRVAHITSLAGYVTWKLSGRQVLGIGDASGVFPVDSATGDYNTAMIEAFDELDGVRELPWRLPDLLPEVMTAGDQAGTLTEHGAHLLDPTGTLRAGALMAPPEGDAGTGMVATNSVRPRSANVSGGTSAFAMVVLENELAAVREEIDLVATPSGDPVGMIHTNNCSSDLDAWLRIFEEFGRLTGSDVDKTTLYRILFGEALRGSADGGGVLVYNYLSGEHQADVQSGRPLVVRSQDAQFTLANFMRAQLYSAFGALAMGMQVLLNEENVRLDTTVAHGGIFRTQNVAQQILADSLGIPVSVCDVAGEGGAWGMALLAAYTGIRQTPGARPLSLAEYLSAGVFAEMPSKTVHPDPEGAHGAAKWLERYRTGLQVERLAGEVLD